MIRLIGIDVDGTLLDSQGLMPAANRDAIHDAVAAGIHVALVTGRSYPFARPVAEPLPPTITLIVSGGADLRSRCRPPIRVRVDGFIPLLIRHASHCPTLTAHRGSEVPRSNS